MNKTTNILSLCASLYSFTIFIFGLVLTCSNSTVSAETYLSADLVRGNKDEVVQIPVFFETNETVVGADIIIIFDEEEVQLGEILAGNSISNHDIYDDQSTPGELKLTILSMTNEPLSDGNLSLLSFLLLKDYSEPTDAVTVDLTESLLISQSATPFNVSPISPVTDISLNFPLEPNGDTFAIDREIQFSAETDGTLTSYRWNMGDQESFIESNSSLAYTYEKPGVYLVTVEASNQYGQFLKSFEITVQDHLWDYDSDDLGYGWKSFEWFGTFFSQSNSNWIYHEDLGWLFRYGETIDTTWIWSEIWGWGWTNYNVFPYLIHSSGDWLFYLKGSSNPIRYYDYGLKSWLDDSGVKNFQTNVTVGSNGGGQTVGINKYYHGDNVAIVAKPANGYVFSGWEGDYNSGLNPLLIIKPEKDVSIQAKFVAINDLFKFGPSVLNLNHLSPEVAEKAVSKVLLKGNSEYLYSGDALEFELFSEGMNTNDATLSDGASNPTLTDFSGVFGENSAQIKHTHLSLSYEKKKFEFLLEGIRKLGYYKFTKSDIVDSIECSIMEVNATLEHSEKRWLSQDIAGNVWLIQSEVNGQLTQKHPTILLPFNIADSWKSWPDGFAVPADFCLGIKHSFSFRSLDSQISENCWAFILHRSKMNGQNEIYSPSHGLVKISK